MVVPTVADFQKLEGPEMPTPLVLFVEQVEQKDLDGGKATISASTSATSPLGTFLDEVSASAELSPTSGMAVSEKQPVSITVLSTRHWTSVSSPTWLWSLCCTVLGFLDVWTLKAY